MNDDPTPINARLKRRPPQALEDLTLALRDNVIWPVGDWALGLSDRGRVLAAGGAVAVAIALGVGCLSLVSSGGSAGGSEAAPVAVATPAPESAAASPQPQAQPEPTLHGAAPVFKPPPDKPKPSDSGSQEVEASAAQASAENTGSAATDTISSSPRADAARVSTTKSGAPVDGPPAGPEAIAVAHEFAETFVVYETGGEKAEIRKGFAATTTPELRRALLRRPPRQPAGVEVPKAKVLNVVAAPSHGSVYPVSVSLLRVGVTSELRLQLEQLKNKDWRVINVLG
ncbi:MAG TPA: hypothetical protein VFS26_03445 [Solirubrobacterales bacterium]|nr:hypothetical protein [Solirubrobacterales bacterium]